MSPGQIILFIIGTIIVIFGAYYVTYYVGVKASGARPRGNKSIILRDRFAISKDKSFCLVEIHGKVYIVGVTNQSMTLLDTLNAEEFAESGARSGGQAYQTGSIQNGIVGSLASFLASRMKKEQDIGGRTASRGGSFDEKLRAADRAFRMRKEPEQPSEEAADDITPDSGPEGKV